MRVIMTLLDLYQDYFKTTLRASVSHEEIPYILHSCHATAYGGHFNGQRIAAKVLQSCYY